MLHNQTLHGNNFKTASTGSEKVSDALTFFLICLH